MAIKTENLNLTKPAQGDEYNVDDFNNNFNLLDEFAGTSQKNVENLNDTVTNHRHNLEDSKIVGILPLAKGGTGGTTKEEALQELGIDVLLKGKANTNHNHSPEEITTTQFKDFVTKEEKEKIKAVNLHYFTVAAYNTSNSLKTYANITCTGEDDAITLQNYINNAPAGSVIYLLPGKYYLKNPLRLNKSITILGAGAESSIVNTSGGYIFSIMNSCVRIKDLQLIRNPNTTNISNHPMIEFYSTTNNIISDVEIKGCLFGCKNMDKKQEAIIGVFNPIELKSLTQIRILENTFLGEDYIGDTIDFSNVENSLSCVIGANVSSNGIKIKAKSTTSIWTYGQRTIYKGVE